MASATARRLLLRRSLLSPTTPPHRNLSTAATATASSSSDQHVDSTSAGDDAIFVKTRDKTSVTMPAAFMTGSIVGKRFYNQVTTRLADDGNGWTVMLDYRTLKTPSKRPLKLRNPALAMAIAAEWDYQQIDGIRPFTMPLMKLACTALERVPLTRPKIIDNLMKKFHQDLVFCRAPDDNDLTKGLHEKQQEKIDPILRWLHSEFGHKPTTYSTFFGGKQSDELTKTISTILKNSTDCELASIDAMAAAAHSLVIPLAICRGRLGLEGAVELVRLEEDLQVDKWGLVEGGHDIDVADLKVQISSAVVFLGFSQRI